MNNWEQNFSARNEFLKDLSLRLGHPDKTETTERFLRATLHTLRNRLSMQENLHLLSQLPVFLKLMFIEGWKYREKPIRYHSVEQFNEAVKEEQFRMGEREFGMKPPTEQMINIVFAALRKYISDGEVQDLLANLPPELHSLFVAEK
jgi:uncharacterized protein (DUF2267 family)